MGVFFGTDGVRDIANAGLSCEIAYKIGRCGAYVLTKENKHMAQILVGMDTRISGKMLAYSLIAGICSVGAKAIMLGILPTPAISYLVRKNNYDAGVVLSASHNPSEYNGIKFFNREGYKLKDELENEIENIMLSEKKYSDIPHPIGANVGTVKISNEFIKDYIDFIKSTTAVSFKGLKVAVDCANGAAYETAPKVLLDLGADIVVINDKPNGVNINQNCGSTNIFALADLVKSSNCDIGLAFDGDADRLIAVDENGQLVDGDMILSICGLYMKQKGLLKKNTIVTTVMSNMGFSLMAQKNNINIIKTSVGDRYVLEEMLKSDYNLGGEQSGHIIFLDHNTTGDGLLTGVLLLTIMKETGKKLSELSSVMQVLPQVLINAVVDNNKKYDYLKDENILNEIKRVENIFKNEGQVLVRASGTENLIRVMIEGKDIEIMQLEAEKLAALIEKILG